MKIFPHRHSAEQSLSISYLHFKSIVTKQSVRCLELPNGQINKCNNDTLFIILPNELCERMRMG